MVQSLRHVCTASDKSGQRKRVILHQGYVLFPSNLMLALANMLDGTWRCGKVDVLVLTNSFDTTDLNIINIFARYQLKPLADRAVSSPSPHKARLKILEYLKPAEGANRSLHSKVNIIGDDLIIGSANADVRSWYMDTNNGFFIRNAIRFIDDYTKTIAKVSNDQSRTRDIGAALRSTTFERIKAEDLALVNGLINQYDTRGFVSPQLRALIEKEIGRLQDLLIQTNRGLMDAETIQLESTPSSSNEASSRRKIMQYKMGLSFDELMMLL
jgi:phosphatidylserine/phosphatidylglycerophosphate/cardiolipin synthase-like enzyme